MKEEIEALFDAPCWIIDILPYRVPADSPGQYFDVEQYFLSEPERTDLRERHIRTVLKLACYRDIRMEEDLETVPPPEAIAEAVRSQRTLLRIGDALLVSDPGDTYLTLYAPDPELLALMKVLAPAEGLFVWQA